MAVDNTEVPAESQKYVNRLRRFLGDTAAQNKLEELKESDDIELFEALEDALGDITFTPPFIKNYASFSEVPWYLLRAGAVLNVLTAKGILSARNTLTYRDAGGVTVQDYDKYGRYINYFNVLINKYLKSLTEYKMAENIKNGWGGVGSEYGDLG